MPKRMEHAFTEKRNGLTNAIISKIEIRANHRSIKVNAVWDTGATGSCISKNVAQVLGLIPVGFAESNTANGKTLSNEYIVDIAFPEDSLILENMRVRDFSGGPHIDMLIGMDIIIRGDFSITNANNKTFMSFRVPSDVFHIDYVAIAHKTKQGKLMGDQLKKNQKG